MKIPSINLSPEPQLLNPKPETGNSKPILGELGSLSKWG